MELPRLPSGLGTARAVRDRERILEKGDAAAYAYLLEKGAVEIVHETPAGTSLVVKILASPNFFGVIELLGGEASYLESVRALGACRITAIPKAQLLQLLRSSLEWCLACLENTSTAFCLAARFEPGHLATIEQKLANYLLALAELGGSERGENATRLAFRRSQNDFAQAIGGSERSVSRILAQWKEDGILSKRNGRYTIHRVSVLANLAGEIAGSLVLARGSTERQSDLEPSLRELARVSRVTSS